jgi:protein SCO1/2
VARRSVLAFSAIALGAGVRPAFADSACGIGAEEVVPAAKPPAPDVVRTIRERNLLNVRLTTHDGRSVRFYDDLVQGRVVAINFMFTNCGSGCPVATANLVQVQKALGDRMGRDITFLSITLDPAHDTAAVLRRHARAYGSGPGWYFLTGKRGDIERLRRGLGAWDPDPAVDRDIRQHVGLVILGNEPRGRWKAVPALGSAVRIRQAIDRTILPPSRWPTGKPVVDEVPLKVVDESEPVDLASLRALDSR